MARQLVVIDRPFSEEAVLDWIRFRIAEGVDDFHVVTTAGPGAEERLAVMVRHVGLSGAGVSAEVSHRRPETVVRTGLRAGHFTGVILASEHHPFSRLAGKLRRLQRRFQVGVVWVGHPPAEATTPDGHTRRRPGRSAVLRASAPGRRGGSEAAA